ncbi:MAG: hypothetical protein R2830_16855 [Saprospiraceae bacterium]
MKKLLFSMLLSIPITSAILFAQCPPPSTPDLGDNCSLAPLLCGNIDGYCGTLATNNVQQPFPGCPSWVLNNDGWLKFVAGSTAMTIQVTPSNCSGGNFSGMQGGIYGSCISQIMDLQCMCTLLPFQLNANNFVVGQEYYLVLDGCAGDVCDFEIDLLAGSTLPIMPGQISGDTLVCPGVVSHYTVPSNPSTTFTWSLTPASAGNLVGTNPNDSISVAWTTAGEAQLCVSTANPSACPDAVVCVTVHSALLPETVETHEVCENECATCAGVEFCNPTPPGGTPVLLTSWQGCDSVVICHINTIGPIVSNLGQIALCGPNAVSICGEIFSQSGSYALPCTNWQGCDSTVSFELAILEPVALIASTGNTLACGIHSILLDGTGSSTNPFQNGLTQYQWTGPGIVGADDQPSVGVNQPGQYCLTVTHILNGVSCSDMACVAVGVDNSEPAITWTGMDDLWNIPLLWDLGYVPEFCNHVIVPNGFPTVPIGYEGVGKTLHVNLGAQLEVPVGAMLDIH